MLRMARITIEVCVLFFPVIDIDIHAGRSFRGITDFSRMLYHAAFYDRDVKKEKEGPLFTEAGPREPKLRIRALQHMTVLHLQRRLAVLAEDIVSSKTATEAQMDQVQETLKDYGTRRRIRFLCISVSDQRLGAVTALRDLRYMLEMPSKDPKVAEFLQNLLYLSASDPSDLAIMMDANLIKEYPLKPRLHVSNYIGEGGRNHTLDTRQRLNEGLLHRVRMALFGGVVVVAPMLIMSLHRTLLTTLLTTSLFVLVVGLVLAWSMDSAQPKDILMATAAYAAILVVFVGTTLPA